MVSEGPSVRGSRGFKGAQEGSGGPQGVYSIHCIRTLQGHGDMQ